MNTHPKPAFKQALESYRRQIDSALADYFNSAESRLGLDLSPHGQEAYGYLREFSLRPGKRLRGALALFSYSQLSQKDTPSIINAAVAVELVQNYLLIIDDVMDRSVLRRGKPTVHELIKQSLAVKDEHLAGMLAINVGLLASHMAQSVLLGVQEEPGNLNQATGILQRNIAITAYGQIDDLYNDLLGSATEPEIISLHKRKNSYYSFISPMHLGAALAGQADKKTVHEIERIGLPAGVAFQLQDDILGLFGDEKVTGKSSFDDLREGKFTLLILYTLERAAKEDADKVRRALGNKELDENQAKEAKETIKSSGALEQVADIAQQYCRQSKDAVISSTIFDEDAKQFLLDLIDFVVNRKV